MKIAVVKYPFKVQDLAIIQITKDFVDKDIHTIPVDYSKIDIDTSNANIILGLGKDDSKVLDFPMSKCESFNNRDVEYFNHLRYRGKLPSTICIRLKKAIRDFRRASLVVGDRTSRSGVFSPLNVGYMINTYDGYYSDMKQEFVKKTNIIQSWLKVVGDESSKRVSNEQLQDALLKTINQIKTSRGSKSPELSTYKEFESLLNEVKEVDFLSYSEVLTLKSTIKDLLDLNGDTTAKRSESPTNIVNLIDPTNVNSWTDLWVSAVLDNVYMLNFYSSKWNDCDFSRDGVVVNTSGVVIPNWKKLAKEEGDIVFFMTPEVNTNNWSLISVYPSKFPLLESSDLPYWTHVSRFLAKFESKAKADRYVDHLLAEHQESIDQLNS